MFKTQKSADTALDLPSSSILVLCVFKSSCGREIHWNYTERSSKMEETTDLLGKAWPGRQAQILKLMVLIGDPLEPAPSFFVYGGPSTGKTALVR